MKNISFTLILSTLMLNCFGQSLFFDHLNHSTWVSMSNLTDQSIDNSHEIQLSKLIYPKDSLKRDFNIWIFKDNVLTVSKYFWQQKTDSLVENFKYTVKDDLLEISLPNETILHFKAGITSSGNFVTLFLKEKTKKITVSGIVSSELDGSPLEFIEVLSGDSGNHLTFTSENGEYSVEVNENETLIFQDQVYHDHETVEIQAIQNEMNVQMKEMEIYHIINLGWVKEYDISCPGTPISFEDLKISPKKGFELNAKNNVYILYVSNYHTDKLSAEDLAFQDKYHIQYAPSENWTQPYLINYNKLTLKHLKKKFKKEWRSTIRKDVIGLK